MSSIVIAGDTSGSVTLQAPAVAGATTVNLPSTLGNTSTSAFVTTDASGNLGLGVTPSVNTVSGSGYRQIEVGTTAGNMIFAGGNELFVSQNVIYNSGWKYAVSTLATQYRQNGGKHEFYTAPTGTAGNTATFTQAMTLDASNRLGIGETSPTATLDVKGTNGIGRFNSSDANGAYVTFANNGTAKGYIGSAIQIITSGSANDFAIQAVNNFVFSAGGAAETARFPATGGFQSKTTISVGDATPSTSGAGITFPATQSASSDANTLDDYEEGTWTPIDSSGAGLSLSVYSARYTKIGRMVECFAQITYPTTANTSQATIGGLPFTTASTTGGAYGAFTVYQSYSTATTWLNSSADTISVAYTLGAGGLTNASLSTHNIRLVWIYEV